MSDSEVSSVGSKRLHGTVENNEDFKTPDNEIWRRNPNPLGKGGYSQVYLYENGGSKWAVKRIPNISAGGRTSSAELEKEKAALIKFSKQERFVDFIGWLAHENIEYFVLEHVQFGNLENSLKMREKTRRNHLKKRGKTGREIKRDEFYLPEAEVKTILTQILEGVEFMHAEGYIHRDLKPANILVAHKGPDWQVKITDLGLSKNTLGVREGYSFTGTPEYMAPEIYGSFLNPSNYTKAIDLWGVGCIACRMLIGEPPFSDPWLLVQYIKAIEELKPIDQLCREVPYIKKPLAELLEAKTPKGLFVRQPEPEKRLGASQALGHPWFRDLDFYAFQGHAKPVVQVAFSRNGELLVSTSWDQTMMLWSKDERKTIFVLESHRPRTTVSFLPDGNLAASASTYDESIRVWGPKTGKEKYTFKTFPLLASDTYNNEITIWSTQKRELKRVFKYTETWVNAKTISLNGELMASIHYGGNIRLWNTETGIEEPIFKGDPRSVEAVAFSPTNRVMALANETAIWLWNMEEHEAKRVSEGSWVRVKDVIFSPNGRWVAWVSLDRKIRLWDTQQEGETRILEGHSESIRAVAFSPNSQLLVSGSWDKTVRLWDVDEGNEQSVLKVHSGPLCHVAFSPKDKLVATASVDGLFGLWNVSQWMKYSRIRNRLPTSHSPADSTSSQSLALQT